MNESTDPESVGSVPMQPTGQSLAAVLRRGLVRYHVWVEELYWERSQEIRFMARESRRQTTAKRKRSSAAPDSFRGFSLQATRFLFRLLDADLGETVSLEVFEDVGVQHADGSRIAEQDKSNLASNPLSDRSVEFWKTLGNWVKSVQRGELDADRTRFILYTSHPAAGAIARAFSDTRTLDDARSALHVARTSLGGDASQLPKSLRPHIEIVFQAEEKFVASIISRFSLDVGLGDSHAELRAAFLKELVSEDAVDDVLRWAHGWVKTEIDRLHNQRKPASIKKDEFHQALLNYVRAHDRTTILRSVAGIPTEAEIQGELAFRNYVRQLHLIELEEEDTLEAVNDFLRASTDRTEWADQGWIGESSVEEFGKNLKRAWKNYRDRTFIGFSEKPVKQQGTLLLRECLGHESTLDHLEVPPHFTRGSWHALADDLSLGWHPQYREELERQESARPDTEGGSP